MVLEGLEEVSRFDTVTVVYRISSATPISWIENSFTVMVVNAICAFESAEYHHREDCSPSLRTFIVGTRYRPRRSLDVAVSLYVADLTNLTVVPGQIVIDSLYAANATGVLDLISINPAEASTVAPETTLADVSDGTVAPMYTANVLLTDDSSAGGDNSETGVSDTLKIVGICIAGLLVFSCLIIVLRFIYVWGTEDVAGTVARAKAAQQIAMRAYPYGLAGSPDSAGRLLPVTHQLRRLVFSPEDDDSTRSSTSPGQHYYPQNSFLYGTELYPTKAPPVKTPARVPAGQRRKSTVWAKIGTKFSTPDHQLHRNTSPDVAFNANRRVTSAAGGRSTTSLSPGVVGPTGFRPPSTGSRPVSVQSADYISITGGVRSVTATPTLEELRQADGTSDVNFNSFWM